MELVISKVKEFVYILLLINILLCTFQTNCAVNSVVYTDTHSQSTVVTITSEADCQLFENKTLNIDPDDICTVEMALVDNSSCVTDPLKKGFRCSVTVYQMDPLAMVAASLCVDLQGVPQKMPDTQLLLTVYNQKMEMLKEVYTTIWQLAEGKPYYICSDESQSKITLSLTVLGQVKMCPEIMNKLVGRSISFGTVQLLPSFPTYVLSLDNGSQDVIVKEESSIVKVRTENKGLETRMHYLLNDSYQNTNSCLEIIYISIDYRCDISLELSGSSQFSLKLNVPGSSSFPALRQRKDCKVFNRLDKVGDIDLILLVRKRFNASCSGSFALKISFSENFSEDGLVDSYLDDMKHLYMAVFIALVSVCLIILCVTLILCLRMRAKRLQNIQRRHQAGSGPNVGFFATQNDFDILPVSWSSNDNSRIHGLPSYDELFGKSTEDPTADSDSQVDKPPAYETLEPYSP